MRIGLAIMIVVWHTAATCYGLGAQAALSVGPTRPVWALLLPMFFALSGFLVSGSLERSRTLVSFLGLRVIRLVPALLVESLIAVIILGPLFTSLPLSEYFSSPVPYEYLGNIVGNIHYYLPGVFSNNPHAPVNGQLWTLPYELKCYAAIAIFALLGAYRVRTLMVAGCALFLAYAIYRTFTEYQDAVGYGIVGGRSLVVAFLLGALFYRLRDMIPYSAVLGAISGLLAVILLSSHDSAPFGIVPTAYLTVYLGLLNPPRSKMISSGDYSYGIFLYGFPIQQAVSALFPNYRYWWFNLVVSLPIVIAVAYLSWHLVEKRALGLRPLMKRLEARFVPLNDHVLSLFSRLLPPGLRSRWVPMRD